MSNMWKKFYQREDKNRLGYNLVMDADSYKFGHFPLYPKDMRGMYSYGEARIKTAPLLIPFGSQMWVKKTLLTPITRENIEEAELFAPMHGEPFNKDGWLKILNKYGGYLPVTVYAVPEGLPVPSGNVLYAIECIDDEVQHNLAWLSSYLETSAQRGIWYPTTIATMDHGSKKVIRRFSRLTDDNEALIPFTLHDFAGRGVTVEEQAQVGGAAHLVGFMGSDTVSGVRAANFYYGADNNMAAFSVIATEHSIQCAFGPERQREYIASVLDTYAKPGAIISIVLDGYDTMREARLLMSFKEQIKKSGAKIVLRPDSGDASKIVPELLQLAEATFGSTLTSKGFKVVNNVGVIQGDGIDREIDGVDVKTSLEAILKTVTHAGFATCNVVFGSGGGLLQNVNRDTLKFAQKASAYLNDKGEWIPMWKDPITDPGKKSKSGRLTLVRSRMTGKLDTFSSAPGAERDGEWEEVLRPIYRNGELLVDESLDVIRQREEGKA